MSSKEKKENGEKTKKNVPQSDSLPTTRSKVKLLDKDFIGIGEVKGKVFRQIKKGRYVYIYEVDDHYEVFKRVVNRRFNNETYPSSKQFGITAFTAATFEEAAERYKELTAKYKKQNEER